MQARGSIGRGLVSLALCRSAIAGYLEAMNKHTPLVVAALMSLVLLPGCQDRPALVLVTADAEADAATPSPAQAVAPRTRGAAKAVLAALTDEQRKKAVRPIKHDLRRDWHFVPRERQGVTLGELDTKQKTLVHNLMQTALSDSGYLKATDIIWLETVLYEMSNQNAGRDPGKYVLQIYGDPADDKAAWGWRLEGHHLSINLTYSPEAIGVTPLFFGTNPAVPQQGPLAGKRVLADAHNLAVELAKSMNDEQRKKLMLMEKPRDVITGPGREKALKEPVGISSSELNKNQQFALLKLVGAHWDSLAFEHRTELVDRVLADSTYPDLFQIAWAGPIDPDQPFYYRIMSKHGKFVIEYSCQGRNHVHCVMHDLTDPLQEDLLKKHFEQHEH